MAAPDPDRSPQPRTRWRWAWWLLAWCSLGLGVIGIFVPGLPTTVFVLISAWAASRGSHRLHQWLLQHPRFGPAIVHWQAHRAVSRRAKWMATLTMVGCALILLLVMPLFSAHRSWMTALPLLCMAAVAIWLWRRPEPSDMQRTPGLAEDPRKPDERRN